MVKEVVCKKCWYPWETKSEMYYVSCPKCGSKVYIKEELNTEGDDGTRGSIKTY